MSGFLPSPLAACALLAAACAPSIGAEGEVPEDGGAAAVRPGAGGGAGAGGGPGAGGAGGGVVVAPPLPVPTSAAGLRLADGVAVVISEIMYHPVDETTDAEVHEFIEVHNRGKAAVDLGGWKLGSGKAGMSYTFPAGTSLPAGRYQVVAKDRKALAAVAKWGVAEADLLGPYTGELDNGGATVVLEDARGNVVDGVTYRDQFPWPIAADALGVGEDWLPVEHRPMSKHRYMGRSLERVSTDAVGATPANWEASALDGATPGKPNTAAGAVVPVAESVTALGERSQTHLVRADEKIVISARFSAFAPVSKVELESFVDDIAVAGEPTTTVAMTAGADGTYTTVLGPFKDNTLLRYRVRAVRGDKTGVAAPRATDPLAWYTAFVSPKVFVKPGVESKARTYHLWITPQDWTRIEQSIAAGRATGTAGCTANPTWNLTVPATFIHEGKAYDVRVRYEGSRYQRINGARINTWNHPGPQTGDGKALRALSWRIKLPRYDQIRGQKKISLNKMLQGCPGTVTHVESALLEKAGLPSYRQGYARLHINGGYYHYMAEPEEIDEALIERFWPGEPVGDLFKNDGPGGDEGPAARGDWRPIRGPNTSCPVHTIPERYAATYPRVTYEHRPYDELVQLITDLSAAKTAGPQAVRDHFTKHWDVGALAAAFAVRNWAGVWDDTFHNVYPYKRPSNGKWYLLQQDFEGDMGLGKVNPTGIAPLGTWNPRQTLYIGWNSPDPNISKMCELPAGQEKGCNGLGFLALKDAFIGAFRKELDDKYRELVKKGVLGADGVLAVIDEAVSLFSMDDWMATPAGKACDVNKAHEDMRTWARERHATIVGKLMP